MAATDAPAPSTPLRHNPSFLKLWCGQTSSVFGAHVSDVAVQLTAVLVLGASATQMGLLGTARWVPFLLLTLPVGLWADRVRRRPLLVGADLGRAIAMGTIVLLVVLDLLTMQALLVAVFTFGALTVVFDVAYYSYVPHVVPRDLLVAANSRLQATYSIGQMGGPSAAGVLVQTVGAPITLLVNVGAFLASAASLQWIRQPEPRPAARGEKRSGLIDIHEGLQIVYRNPHLRALVGCAGTYNLFNQWIVVLLVLYAVNELGVGAAGAGLALSSDAAGAIIGAIFADRLSHRLGIGRLVLWAMTLACVIMLAIAFVPAGVALTLPLLMLILGLNGFGIAIASIAAVSIRQAVTPSRLLGRMTASYRFVSYGMVAIGALAGGFAGELLGLRIGLFTGAVGMLGAIGWVAVSPLRRLESVDEATEAVSTR